MKNKKMRGYLVSDLLIGTLYKSPNSYKEGTITLAVKSDYSENAYLVSYWNGNKYENATIEVVL
jgi:hypothetical protein